MKLTSTSVARLILPDGTIIPPGASVDVSKEVTENLGVKEWVASGLASFGKVAAKAKVEDPEPQPEPQPEPEQEPGTKD